MIWKFEFCPFFRILKNDIFKELALVHPIFTLVGWVFYAFFCHGSQLHRGTIESLNWIGEIYFLAFPWHPLLLIAKVNPLQMPKNQLAKTVETFNSTPAKLSSIEEKKHKTPTQPKWIDRARANVLKIFHFPTSESNSQCIPFMWNAQT